MSAETIRIDALGAQGDGVAQTAAGPLYVPFTLPGETVSIARVKSRGTLLALREPAPERVEPLFPCPPGARRRAVMTARRTADGLLLGYNQAETNRIVSIEVCPIAHTAITERFDNLRAVASALAVGSKPFRLTVLATASGLDVAASEVGRLGERQRRAVVETALDQGLARLTVDGEILIEPRRPIIHFGTVPVSPPPGGFVQASAEAETHMAGLVETHLRPVKRIADLFAGAGTFALRLAREHPVHAAESDGPALAALDRGFRETPGLKPVTTERRDLYRRPLTRQELEPYEGVVFDPPRAGAEAQCHEIASSSVKRIAAVSCNPATLARDLRILVGGGYRIGAVHPVDQFLWSSHVEAVALLSR